MPNRAATFLLRLTPVLAGVLLAQAYPRAALAAGCHRGDRPTSGDFVALWAASTSVDPLLESAPSHEVASPGAVVPRPCSDPAPGQTAPGHATLPAWDQPAVERPFSPPSTTRAVRSDSPPYEYRPVSGLRRPPRRPISD